LAANANYEYPTVKIKKDREGVKEGILAK